MVIHTKCNTTLTVSVWLNVLFKVKKKNSFFFCSIAALIFLSCVLNITCFAYLLITTNLLPYLPISQYSYQFRWLDTSIIINAIISKESRILLNVSNLSFQKYEWVAISCLTMVSQVVRNKQKQNNAGILRTCGIKIVDHCHFWIIIAHIYITAKHFFSLAIPVHCLVSWKNPDIKRKLPIPFVVEM